MPSLLDEAIKVGQELETAAQRKEALEAQIAAKQAELKRITAEAEQAARGIVQAAQSEANRLINAAQALMAKAEARLMDAQTLEHSGAWIKEEDARLKRVAQEVAVKEHQAAKLLSDASAKSDLFASKIQSLAGQEQGLAQREQAIAAREAELKIEPPKKAEKGSKKALT